MLWKLWILTKTVLPWQHVKFHMFDKSPCLKLSTCQYWVIEQHKVCLMSESSLHLHDSFLGWSTCYTEQQNAWLVQDLTHSLFTRSRLLAADVLFSLWFHVRLKQITFWQFPVKHPYLQNTCNSVYSLAIHGGCYQSQSTATQCLSGPIKTNQAY